MMRKATVTILAVAIIGALGLYAKSDSAGSMASASRPQPAAGAANSQPPGQAAASAAGPAMASGSFKDGSYTGNSQDTAYGPVQIAAVISGGAIKNISFLQMPSDRGHSQEVTAFAAPLLKQETLQKQSANIDFVSGATSTSAGYQQSLQSALDQAAKGAAGAINGL